MSKFNAIAKRGAASGQIPTGRTYEGAPGYARDPQSELFLLAVVNMCGENTFYERADDRDSRFAELVRHCTINHPLWTARFLRWLRTEANMRTAALVGAAEYVRAWSTVRCGARLDGSVFGGTICTRSASHWSSSGEVACDVHRRAGSELVSPRRVVDSVLQRADEPGEMLAYWASLAEPARPFALVRGVADAAQRLYNERSWLKWDSAARGYRFADVIELCHPTPRSPGQSDLFAHILDQRHGRRPDATIPESLATLRKRERLMAIPAVARHTVITAPDATQVLLAAGMTWESLAGWLQGPMDAPAWQAVIPTMGYMALLRNLRNFDDAGLGGEVTRAVAERLTDPAEVADSRQLPMRFLSAHRAASPRWHAALDIALQHSLANIPELIGRTLILVDRSGSMFYDRLSKWSELTRADAAALFGSALAQRCESATLVEFDHTSREIGFSRGDSVLQLVQHSFSGSGGTNTADAVRRHYAGHHRVVIITDEQTHSGFAGDEPTQQVPQEVPVYTWNLAGYEYGHGPSGEDNRWTFGGLSDQAFKVIALLEADRDWDRLFTPAQIVG